MDNNIINEEENILKVTKERLKKYAIWFTDKELQKEFRTMRKQSGMKTEPYIKYLLDLAKGIK